MPAFNTEHRKNRAERVFIELQQPDSRIFRPIQRQFFLVCPAESRIDNGLCAKT